MFIMADGEQVAPEGIRKLVTVRYRVIVAFFLMVLDSLDHLHGHIRIHIVFGQPGADGVDGLLPSVGVKLDVVGLRTRRKRKDVEAFDTWRLGTSELKDSEGIDVVSATVNKKGESIGRAMNNRNEREAACLVSERSQTIRTVLRVIFLHIGSDSVVVRTIKSIEKCTQCATSWGIRYIRIGACTRGHDCKNDKKQCTFHEGAISSF